MAQSKESDILVQEVEMPGLQTVEEKTKGSERGARRVNTAGEPTRCPSSAGISVCQSRSNVLATAAGLAKGCVL